MDTHKDENLFVMTSLTKIAGVTLPLDLEHFTKGNLIKMNKVLTNSQKQSLEISICVARKCLYLIHLYQRLWRCNTFLKIWQPGRLYRNVTGITIVCKAFMEKITDIVQCSSIDVSGFETFTALIFLWKKNYFIWPRAKFYDYVGGKNLFLKISFPLLL